MGLANIKLDHKGMAELLKSEGVAGAVHDAAEAVAGHVSATAHGESIPVVVSDYTTDRAASGVTMKHPGALGVEAVRGPLGKAVSAAGLSLRKKGGG